MSGNSLESVLIDVVKSNGFTELLAGYIADSYGQRLMDDFGNQITKALGEHVEKTVEKYVKDWIVDENIKKRVGAVFRNIDKIELLEALKEKDWTDL